jgi:hypothetical protein
MNPIKFSIKIYDSNEIDDIMKTIIFKKILKLSDAAYWLYLSFKLEFHEFIQVTYKRINSSDDYVYLKRIRRGASKTTLYMHLRKIYRPILI